MRSSSVDLDLRVEVAAIVEVDRHGIDDRRGPAGTGSRARMRNVSSIRSMTWTSDHRSGTRRVPGSPAAVDFPSAPSMPLRSPRSSERAARAARSISVGSGSSAPPADGAGWRDRAEVKAPTPWRRAYSSPASRALLSRRTAIAERALKHRVGAAHVAGAVGYAAFQIRLRCATEMKLCCSGAAMRPPAGIVGQFEQRPAARGGIERLLLLMCPLRAAASARDLDISRILESAPLRSVLSARSLPSQDRRDAGEKFCRGPPSATYRRDGRRWPRPFRPRSTTVGANPHARASTPVLHERSPLAFATLVVVCALPVGLESAVIVTVLGT